MHQIVRKRALAPQVILYHVKAPGIAAKALAGQFAVIRVREEGERIPLTIAERDPEQGTITLVVQEVGKSTKLLGTRREGDSLTDVIGPLGRPTEIPEGKRVVVVGGGIGTAVALPIARAMREKGNHLTSIIGFRSKEMVIFEREVRDVSDEVHITTDDGSAGRHGLVTSILGEFIEQERAIDLVLAIGPAIMMRAVSELTRPHGLKTIVSLNSIMVDGTGMCGACRVTVGGLTRFVCVDGPEFDGHLVDFDELMSRLQYYRQEEQLADKAFMETTTCAGHH